MPGKIGLWGTQRSHPWVKFPAFHSLSNEPSFRTLGQGLFLSGTKVPVFPLPFAIEDRFKSDYNPDPKFILSCMLTPHLPERQEIVDFLKTQNLEHSFIGQIKARAADIEAIAKLGVSHPDLIKKGGTGLFHNTEYYRQIHESRACISVPGGGFDTLRFWEILGQGSLLISKRVALEMPNPLEEGKHYLAFDSLKELKAVIKRLYSRPEKLDSIRASGYQHAMRFHTASVRASWFLEKISNLK